MRLLSGPLSMFGAKAQIAVAEKGIDCEVEMVPFSIKDRYSPTHPDVARINPKKQIPVLLHGAVEIFVSTQIFEYLEDRFPAPALWPASAESRAFARLMELKSDEVFFPSFFVLLQTLGDPQKPETQSALATIAAYYAEMDALLADRDYIAGDYSYADIAFMCVSFFTAFMGGVPDPDRQLAAWRKRMMARAAVAPVVHALALYLTENRLKAPAL
ncbi:MAG: glutathione S-transferase family protein [Alphaproteobacteria bacterium HGW-Alphaproteobacteria-11]|nr:MAG: glutathione S-transferase family protein [Alphaproteobacteria bacterium HGW-Alphaproteobacteria-11]